MRRITKYRPKYGSNRTANGCIRKDVVVVAENYEMSPKSCLPRPAGLIGPDSTQLGDLQADFGDWGAARNNRPPLSFYIVGSPPIRTQLRHTTLLMRQISACR